MQARALLLSYQNVLKIDNLVGFDKLIKLQLYNNIIEKIENLGHLVHREVRQADGRRLCSRVLGAPMHRPRSAASQALDLSFNNISEISGLDNLTNLTNLSLFSNHITTIGGMDTLHKLQVPP